MKNEKKNKRTYGKIMRKRRTVREKKTDFVRELYEKEEEEASIE